MHIAVPSYTHLYSSRTACFELLFLQLVLPTPDRSTEPCFPMIATTAAPTRAVDQNYDDALTLQVGYQLTLPKGGSSVEARW